MKATKAQQQALLTLLSRIYSEIRAIEEKSHIIAREGDYRPRVDYFHDAVRELTQGESSGFEDRGRLAVESLAHDIVMLRQIKDNPRITYPDLPIPLSVSTELVEASQSPTLRSKPRIDVGVVATLAEGYAHYALLFSALFAYPAERNFINRTSEQQEQMDEVKDLIDSAQQGSPGGDAKLQEMLEGIRDPDLRQKLMAAVQAVKLSKHATNAETVALLKKQRETIRDQRTALDAAHMRFASSQLMLYQEAPKIVKKLAAEGLNIVGEFVESAVREAERGGRGF